MATGASPQQASDPRQRLQRCETRLRDARNNIAQAAVGKDVATNIKEPLSEIDEVATEIGQLRSEYWKPNP